MLVALFALIAMGSIQVFDGGEEDLPPAPEPISVPEIAPMMDRAVILAARARFDKPPVSRPRHTVVADLRRSRDDGEVLVLEYDGHGPVPELQLEHDADAGFSRLYAAGRLVLEVINTPGTPQITLDEIKVSPC